MNTSNNTSEMTPASSPRPEQTLRFACMEPGCTRAFNRKYTLSEHMKTHTGEKPHVCPIKTCGKRFTTSGNLSRHKRLHGPILPIVCPVTGCECSFSNDAKLEKHMKFHLGTAEHACQVPGCGKTFSTFGNLNRHMRNQHTREERLAVAQVDTTGRFRVASPTASDEYRSPSPCSSDDEIYEDEWLAGTIASMEPLGRFEPREPWNPEMLEALSMILDEQLVLPDGDAM
ncbi:Zinc finger protein, partial [Globisporangium splendens]